MKILENRELAAMFEDEDGVFITVAFPTFSGYSQALSGRILYSLHKKVKKENLPIYLDKVETEYWRRIKRAVYKVLRNENGLFDKFYELLNESILEAFSDPELLLKIEVGQLSIESMIRRYRVAKPKAGSGGN